MVGPDIAPSNIPPSRNFHSKREGILIDTVKFGFPLSLTSEQLEKWDKENVMKHRHLTCKTRVTFETWLPYNTEDSIHVIYYPQNMKYEPEPLLLFEMSLPKMLYGDNIHMIDNPSLAIESAHQIIRQHPRVPMVDLNQGILYRIDLCNNFPIGDYVSEWIRQLYKLEYPRWRTKPYYPSNGVQYYSEEATLSFYDKEDQTKRLEAHGILRMEGSWLTKNRVGKLVGRSFAKIGDFPIDVVGSLLNAELEKLGIRDRAPVDSLATLRILMKKYRPQQGRRLYGTLSALQIAPSSDLKAMGMIKQTISRDRKAIIAAGLSLCMTENVYPLPKLVITSKGLVQ